MSAVTLPDLAGRIEAEHQAAIGASRTALEHAVRCGELLIQAKADVGHGGWIEWLEDNCTVRPRTAQVYMKLARELPKLPEEKAQRVAFLTVREAVHTISQSTARIAALPAPQQDQVLELADTNGERLVVAHHQVARSASLEATFSISRGLPARFNGERRKRLLKNAETRQLKLVIGPNTAGLHVNKLVSSLKETEEHQDQQNEIDELTRTADELERQAAEMRREAERRQKDLRAWVTAEIVEQHGPVHPFIETVEYSVDDATFAQLMSVPSEQAAIDSLLEANLTPDRRDYWGDIRHMQFDWPAPASGWTGVGNDHGLPQEIIASIAPPDGEDAP
jgi:hypothetical protein